MLDSGVNFVAETNVLLELALGVDAGDDVVTVTRPGDRDLAPDLMKDPTPHTPHLHVLQAVADEDGRVGVVTDDRLVRELPGRQEEAGEDEGPAEQDRTGERDVESECPACRPGDSWGLTLTLTLRESSQHDPLGAHPGIDLVLDQLVEHLRHPLDLQEVAGVAVVHVEPGGHLPPQEQVHRGCRGGGEYQFGSRRKDLLEEPLPLRARPAHPVQEDDELLVSSWTSLRTCHPQLTTDRITSPGQ